MRCGERRVTGTTSRHERARKDTGYRLASVSVRSWFRKRHWFRPGSGDPISRGQDVVNVAGVLLDLAFLAILRKTPKKRFGSWATGSVLRRKRGGFRIRSCNFVLIRGFQTRLNHEITLINTKREPPRQPRRPRRDCHPSFVRRGASEETTSCLTVSVFSVADRS
jgi:hypothetical protein